MNGLSCRPATETDHPFLCNLLLELQASERGRLVREEEDQDTAFARVLADGKNYVIETAGELVGGAQVRVLGDPDDGEYVGFIMMIAVQSEHRRHGYGSLLLSYLLDELRSLGVRQLILNVRADNLLAKAFYHRHGFSTMSEQMAKSI